MEKSSFVLERRVESLHNAEQENFQFFKGAEDLPVLIYLWCQPGKRNKSRWE